MNCSSWRSAAPVLKKIWMDNLVMCYDPGPPFKFFSDRELKTFSKHCTLSITYLDIIFLRFLWNNYVMQNCKPAFIRDHFVIYQRYTCTSLHLLFFANKILWNIIYHRHSKTEIWREKFATMQLSWTLRKFLACI